MKSKQQCYNEAIAAGLKPGMADFEEYVMNCQVGGAGGGEPPPPVPPAGSPCEYSGYLGHQVKRQNKWVLLTACKEGHKPSKASDGRIWCCATSYPVTKNGGENGGTAGEGCTGGYPLSQSKITTPGPGSAPKAEIGGGWIRDPRGQGHWYYHVDYGWWDYDTAEKQVKQGIKPSKMRGAVCPKDHEFKVINGEEWCCPSAATVPTTPPGQEFTWSPEMLEAIRSLLARYEDLLNRPMGLTAEERQAIVNYALRGMRGGERGRMQSIKDQLARMGMAGQPLELAETETIRRETREGEADIRSKLGIYDIERSLQTLLGTTGAASNILQLLLSTEQIPEMLSAARRGEGTTAMQQLLNYLGITMGGQGNSYWQAIMNYMMGGGGGEGSSDWLSWLGYLLGRQIA